MTRRFIGRPQIGLSVIAALAAAALIIIAVVHPAQAAAGWLIAFLFMSAVPLGSLTWLLIHRTTGGHWGEALRPGLEAAAAATPLLVLAFIPVLVALPLLYPWASGSADAVKPDVVIFYLNIPLFILRFAIAFVGWSVLVFGLSRMSGRAGLLLAAAGLIFHTVMVTLVSVDWILSTEPPFISTSFGATIIFTQLLAALAFAALFAPDIDKSAVRDLGGFMLAVVLGVTYINFMAVLVLWYGDLPTKISWFVERVREPWTALAVAAFAFASVIPILLLLLERVRASRAALHYVAINIFIGIALFDAWLLAPAYGVAALGTAALAVIALSCGFVAVVRMDWPRQFIDRARKVL